MLKEVTKEMLQEGTCEIEDTKRSSSKVTKGH